MPAGTDLRKKEKVWTERKLLLPLFGVGQMTERKPYSNLTNCLGHDTRTITVTRSMLVTDGVAQYRQQLLALPT